MLHSSISIDIGYWYR